MFGIPISLLKFAPLAKSQENSSPISPLKTQYLQINPSQTNLSNKSPNKSNGSGTSTASSSFSGFRENPKFLNSIYKLSTILDSKRKTIYDFLENCKMTQKGYLSYHDLGIILRSVDQTYTNSQIESIFISLSGNNKTGVSIGDLIKIYSFTTQNFNKNQKTLNSMSSYTYPVRYANNTNNPNPAHNTSN